MRVRGQGRSRLLLNAHPILVLSTPFIVKGGGITKDGSTAMDENGGPSSTRVLLVTSSSDAYVSACAPWCVAPSCPI